MLNLLYIDAAATTAIVSAATAAVVAFAAWGIIQWRKFKKGVSKILHVDENANKEKEEDLVITDETIVENQEPAEKESENPNQK